MIRIIITGKSLRQLCILLGILTAGVGIVLSFVLMRHRFFASAEFELTDELGGNIFPAAILSVAATDTLLTIPVDTPVLGNPKSGIAVRIVNPEHNARLQIELAATPFFEQSVSEFLLPEKGQTYTVYPDILWNYEALLGSTQAAPVNIAAEVRIKNRESTQRIRTFSVRSINECLLGYVDSRNRFHSTDILFAAYVNEDSPLIDGLLREALNTRIVNRFVGYQSKKKDDVERQVYAIWNVLQRRKFRYSSISYSSLSSNVVFSQRVRTLEDALKSSQINCVDGSVLFASLLRAINIDPILVRVPGHMYVGYYTDPQHKHTDFIETSMIGDITLEDYFPEENTDSLQAGKSQEQMSRLTFDKAREYARKKYAADSVKIHSGQQYYMFLEISKALRRKIQPLGK